MKFLLDKGTKREYRTYKEHKWGGAGFGGGFIKKLLIEGADNE